MGDFPLMTNGGTFVINGAERVIVSQIVRSPGVYFGDEVDKTDQHIYSATVIPYRGAWLEYETDYNNVFWVRIDKNRKLPITCLIRALGVATDGQITGMFGEDPLIKATMDKDPCKTREESLLEIYRRLHELLRRRAGQRADLLLRPHAVGRVERVAVIQIIFLRQQPHRLPQDADPAEAGIEKGDRPILILHAHASRKRTICSRSYSPPSMLMRSVRSGGSVFAHSS